MKALIISLSTFMFTGFIVASMMIGCIEESLGGGCGFESIASYNPAYQLGCQLFRKRWPTNPGERANGYCDPNANECDTDTDDEDYVHNPFED